MLDKQNQKCSNMSIKSRKEVMQMPKKTVTMTVRMTPEMRRDFKEHCQSRDVDVSDKIRLYIKKVLANEPTTIDNDLTGRR